MISFFILSIAFAADPTPPAEKAEVPPIEQKSPPAESVKDAEPAPDQAPPQKKAFGLRKKGETPKRSEEKDKPGNDTAPPAEENRGIPAPETEKEEKSDLDRELLQGLGQDLQQVPDEESDPLMRVGRRMRSVEERLARLEATDDTISEQQKIIEDLEELLKQAQNPDNQDKNKQKKQQQQQQQQQQEQGQNQKGKQQPKQQQGNENTNQAGPPRPASAQQGPADPRQVKDVWGHLSELMREEMSQYAKEGFLPKYRDMLEKYYSDIAQKSKSAP